MSKETAAATAANHQKITEAEGKRLAAISGAKVEGRKRQGLTAYEEKAIVGMLRARKTWDDVVDKYGREVEAEVLAGWKENLERRAATPDGPRKPDGR